MAHSLAGKVVLVTGGGRGLGAVYSKYLASAGAKLAVADIDWEGAQQIASQIVAGGGQALALPVDISDEDSVRKMVSVVEEKWGKLDVLINNAALFGGLQMASLEEITTEEWDRVMHVNLRGTFLVTKAVVPLMKAQGKGKIINISSNTVLSGGPYLSHYVTSKAGIVGFTRSLAKELGRYNINVNAVMPGLTDTPAATKVIPKKRFQTVAQERSISRRQIPQDLCGVIWFLAAEESDFVTGQSINVDGGFCMH